jgi:phosphate-selective porin OprO/OprP
MNRVVPLLVLAALGLALATPACAEEAATAQDVIREEIRAYYEQEVPEDTFRVFWKNGFNLQTADKKFKMGFHGRIMVDSVFFTHHDENLEDALDFDFGNGTFFRRAWLTVNGTVYEHIAYMAQYAFETVDGPGFLDVWVGLAGAQECLGCSFPDFRIGHFQEPFGLAWLTSSKFFQLTAWPTPTTTFTPGYNSGIEFNRQWFGDRLTARVGFFGNTSNFAGIHNWTGGYGITGRVTWTPWAPCDCDCRVLHLGISASYRGDTRVARFRSRADIDFGPSVIDTGEFDASEAMLVDFEIAWVYDRFNIQSETTIAQVEADAGTDPLFWGTYVQAGYQLFGSPCRTYSKKTGSFGATKVDKPLFGDGCCGRGAWELAARASYVDLDDGDKQGGTATDFAVGVNYFLNSNTRVMVDWVWGDLENVLGGRLGPDPDGTYSALAVRFQVYW